MHDMASSKSSSMMRLKWVYPAALYCDSLSPPVTISGNASWYLDSMQTGHRL